MVSILYASRRAASDQETNALSQAIQAEFDRLQKEADPSVQIKIIAASEEFDSNFARCGGWDAWAKDVATGVGFADRKPRYRGFVLTDHEVGRATASIVEQGLAAGKPVFFFENGLLRHVHKVEEGDIDNWQSGWRVIVE
jgi:hypothetical protein